MGKESTEHIVFSVLLGRVPGCLLQDLSLQNEKGFSLQLLNICLTVAMLHGFGKPLPFVMAGSRTWGLCLSFFSSPQVKQDKRRVLDYVGKFSEQQCVAGLYAGGEGEAELFVSAVECKNAQMVAHFHCSW